MAKLLQVLGLLAVGLLAAPRSSRADQPSSAANTPHVAGERRVHWQFFQPVDVRPAASAELAEFLLTREVFDAARLDLADLRLFDADDREIPYALQIRRTQDKTETVAAEIFNRTEGPDLTSQLSLDLGEERVEHNELQVHVEGQDFRRQVRVEGSDDGEAWSRIVDQQLLNFQTAQRNWVNRTVRYPSPSRYRYLRVTVWPDPEVDEAPVAIETVTVRRRVEVPGEFVTWPVALGERQALREQGNPASSWILELGGRDVPCSRLRVEVGDAEFVRDWSLEAGGPAETGEPFRRIASGTWRRRAGQASRLLEARFDEVQAARLRLIVTDHRNPPLEIRQITAEAAARAVVFPDPPRVQPELRLFYGNPAAAAPHYDFARNLPTRLEPAPPQLSLGTRQENPTYQPQPLPWTERWPALIYVLLGLAIAVLGLLILNLARTAIRIADERPAEAPAS